MLTGPLEPTNEPYAIAKIAGIKMAEASRSQYGSDFINVMPTNLYGPGDNYHPEYSHVVPALIRRFHEAKGCLRFERGGMGYRHGSAGIPLRRRSR
jgi:GDP-L-fucose synthase